MALLPGHRFTDMIFEPFTSIMVTAGIVNPLYPVFIKGEFESIYWGARVSGLADYFPQTTIYYKYYIMP